MTEVRLLAPVGATHDPNLLDAGLTHFQFAFPTNPEYRSQPPCDKAHRHSHLRDPRLSGHRRHRAWQRL